MQKIIFIALILLGSVGIVKAQESDKIWLGGSFGFSNDEAENSYDSENKNNSYSISPEIGFVLSEKVSIGANLNYSYAKSKYGDPFSHISTSTKRINMFGLGAFVRYNVYKTGIATFFVDGAASYSYGKEKYSYYEDNINLFNIGLKPGLTLRASDKVEFVTHIGFLGYDYLKSGDYRNKIWSFTGNLTQISLGVNFYVK